MEGALKVKSEEEKEAYDPQRHDGEVMEEVPTVEVRAEEQQQQVFQIVLEGEDGTETVADAIQTPEGIKLLQPVQSQSVVIEQEQEETELQPQEAEAVAQGQEGHDGQAQGHGVVIQHQDDVQQQQSQSQEQVTYIQVDTSTAEGEQMAETLLHAIDASGNLTGAPEHVAATLLASGATEEAPGGISSTVILGSSSSVPAHETPTPAEDEEETPAELITPDDLTDENVVLAEDASSPTTQQYLLQSPPNYKMELLHYIHGLEADGILDFPVFLQDGVCWSNRLLLTAMSPMIKSLMSGLASDPSHVDTCLIIPELKRVEFMTFHRALFAGENDTQLDFFVLIKVAEILGCELALTTTFPSVEGPFPSVHYKSMFENPHDKKKIFRSLGYELGGSGAGLSATSLKSGSSEATLAQLSRVFRKEVSCDVCQRSFVDQQGLTKHKNMLHSSKPLSSHIKHNATYDCTECKRVFSFAVNLKKHIWLYHTKVPKPRPLSVHNKKRPLDQAAVKQLRHKEKFEDMKCTVCGLETTTWKQLQLHMMDHTNERPFKCDQCGKGFKEAQKLRRHRVIHTGEKNHKCSYCGKGFGLRHNMRQHERIHLGQGHDCKYCGKVFSQTSNLRDHEAQHVREKHVMTVDPGRRASQVFVKNRGRPSIREIDRKKSGSRVVAAVVDDAEEDDPEPVQIAKQGEMEETQENIERFIRETEPQEEEMVKISVVEAVDENAEEDEPPNKMPRRAEKT